MLILTRKIGESVAIGDYIKLRVIGVKGRQVRLGIEAPDFLPVHREEVYLKIQDQNRCSAEIRDSDMLAASAIFERIKF